jgi:hypothetical protein
MTAAHRRRRPRFDTLEPRVVLSGGIGHVSDVTHISLAPAATTSTPPNLLVSGSVSVFHDGDGSLVSIALSGPGIGSFTLTRGGPDPGQLGTIALYGTTSQTVLKVKSVGGRAPGTSLQAISITPGPNGTGSLGRLALIGVTLAPGGLIETTGSVGALDVSRVANGAQIAIGGSLGQFQANRIGSNVYLHAAGNVGAVSTNIFGASSTIQAGQSIGAVRVAGGVSDASVIDAAQGIQSVTIGSLNDSLITSGGSIGRVVVHGNMSASSIVANVYPGLDGQYGNPDDFVADPGVYATIGSVRIA